MNTLLTLRDSDVYPNEIVPSILEWKDRRTGKVVLMDENKNIALVGNKVNEFFLLPGGGIDDHEDAKEGASRECLEETGCRITITHELGITDDYRTRDSRHSINYGFLGGVVSREDSHLTDSEKDVGLYIKWIGIDEALRIFSSQERDLQENKVHFYNTGFNILWDKFFLERASELLKAF